MSIVYLDKDKQSADECQQMLIKALEELLEAARDGQLISFTGAGHMKEGELMVARLGLFNWRVYETAGMLDGLKLQCLMFGSESVQEEMKKTLEGC